jgi:hypothetical protein
MTYKAKLIASLAFATFFLIAVSSFADNNQNGVNSQINWPSPGPSNFPTLLSSDIVGHTDITFGSFFNYYRHPLGIDAVGSDGTDWLVENAFTADFLWAFGIVDVLQVGLVLPLVMYQNGEGRIPIRPPDTVPGAFALSNSTLADIRFNVKIRFLGTKRIDGKTKDPDKRDLGLALDLGLAVPTGDQRNFAGDEGVVFFPNLILDFHRCMVSAAINLGARLRSSESEVYNPSPPPAGTTPHAIIVVGHQGTFGAGVTGHLLKQRLLLSAEGLGYFEFDDVNNVAFEYRGAIGYIPDKGKAITLWLGAGSSVGADDFAGAPQVRAFLSLTYAPKEEFADMGGLF